MLLESLELGRPYLPRPSTAEVVEDGFTLTQHGKTTLGDLKAFTATVAAIRGAFQVYERTRRRGVDRLPFIKLGKYVRFDPNAVRVFLDRQRKP